MVSITDVVWPSTGYSGVGAATLVTNADSACGPGDTFEGLRFQVRLLHKDDIVGLVKLEAVMTRLIGRQPRWSRFVAGKPRRSRHENESEQPLGPGRTSPAPPFHRGGCWCGWRVRGQTTERRRGGGRLRDGGLVRQVATVVSMGGGSSPARSGPTAPRGVRRGSAGLDTLGRAGLLASGGRPTTREPVGAHTNLRPHATTTGGGDDGSSGEPGSPAGGAGVRTTAGVRCTAGLCTESRSVAPAELRQSLEERGLGGTRASTAWFV
jgi:hypothetical protein